MSKQNRLLAILTAIPLGLALFAAQASAGSLAGEDNTMEIVAKKVFPSVVRVESQNGLTKVATGVVLDKDGHIATTALISGREERITVVSSDGRRSQAKFLGFDPETHLALIKSGEKGWTPVALAKERNLAPGSWVGLVSVSPENTPSVAQGIVSSIAPDRLRLNIWVTRGASGSPVVNKDGQMVGLLRGIYAEDQPVVFEFREREVVGSGYAFSRAEAPSSGMALAIPVDLVLNVVAEIKEKGKVSRGWLGVTIAEDEKGRVEVGDVEKDSPASEAKIEAGDLLLSVDGKRITGAQMFVSEIRNRKPGETVQLEIERNGKTRKVEVKLGEYPESEARRELAFRFPGLFPEWPERIPRPAVPEERDSTLRRLIKPRPDWEKRKYIGVYLEEMTKPLLEFFGVREESGLLINQLTKSGPAEKAGLKVGDVIVRADGKALKTINDLSALIQEKKKGDKVRIDFVRDKKPLSLEVEIEEEESPGLAWVSPEVMDAWREAAREFERQFQKSRQMYEKTTRESAEKLRKAAEEMAEKSKEYSPMLQDLYKKNLEKIKENLKSIYEKSKVYFRV